MWLLQADEAILERMVKDAVPTDHPFYPHVAMSLHQLQRNPWWSFEQKEKYIKRLVRTVS